jgi:glycosyltransferase involved in cell wall biosynthesis
MKTVVSTDLLVEKNFAMEIVQTFLEVYEDATMYTLAHKPGEILGPIEQRKITSSFLTHKIKNEQDLKKQSWLVPSACKKLHIPCSTDLILNVSRGLSQGISKCDKPKQITYLYDTAYLPGSGSFREKVFGSMVKNWARKSFEQASEVWLSHESYQDFVKACSDTKVKIVPPFIHVQDFPVGPKGVFDHNYYVINAESVDDVLAEKLMRLFAKKGTPYVFVGQDAHLERLKTQEKQNLFHGYKCNGELAPLFAASRAVIDLTKEAFPTFALSALSTGRPVISTDNPFFDQKIKENSILVEKKPEEEIEKAIDQMDSEFSQYDPDQLHNTINKFHQARFKGEIIRLNP